MMKNNKILIVATLLVLVVSSCRREDWLNPVSVNEIESDNAFLTADRIHAQVLGLYSALKVNNFYGGRYIVYNEVRADNYINLTTNAVTAYLAWNHTTSNNAQEVTGLWNAAYTAINRCNLLIDGIEAGGNEVIGPELTANYLAEAKLIRAISYYSLLQLYARPYWDGNGSQPGVPLRLTGNSGSGDYALARSSVGEVYQQIIADLNDAEAGLPLNYSSAYDNTTRGHRNTAIALKSRVYLSMRQYDDVVTEANKIVSASAPFTATTGVNHALQDDIVNVFSTPYTTSESILSAPMSAVGTGDAATGQSALGSYFYSVREYYLWEAGIISNPNWLETDRRRDLIGQATIAGVERNLMGKYPTPTPYVDYVPIVRYAEVLLSLGEAIARSTNTVDPRAVELLNFVRQRSDETTTFAVSDFSSPQDLFDAFLHERNIELLGEGFRSPDLMRLGLDLPAKGTVSSVSANDESYIWPISQTELLYNPLMTDN